MADHLIFGQGVAHISRWVVETTPKPLVVAPAKPWLTGHSFCFCLFFLVFNIFYFFNNYFL
jgi:hypothetical protein